MIQQHTSRQITLVFRHQHSCGKVMFSQESAILFTGGSVWQTSPLGQIPLLGRDPLGQTLPGQTPPWADNPWADTPAWIDTPLPADTPQQAATAADGKHPTGMYSCLNKKSCLSFFIMYPYLLIVRNLRRYIPDLSHSLMPVSVSMN